MFGLSPKIRILFKYCSFILIVITTTEIIMKLATEYLSYKSRSCSIGVSRFIFNLESPSYDKCLKSANKKINKNK
jgi:hypothetical protein